MIVKFNNWPEPCTWIAVGGGEVKFVKVDLDLEDTSSHNWVRFRLGLDDEAFGQAVREHVRQQRLRVAKEPRPTKEEKSVWTAAVSGATKAARLRQLFARYEEASFDATEVRLQDFVVWLLLLLMPPYFLLAAAIAIRSWTHRSQTHDVSESLG